MPIEKLSKPVSEYIANFGLQAVGSATVSSASPATHKAMPPPGGAEAPTHTGCLMPHAPTAGTCSSLQLRKDSGSRSTASFFGV